MDYVILIQEAHKPWLAHLSEIATANMQRLYMQHFSNPVIATNVIWKVLGFEQEGRLFFFFLPYMGVTVNGAWPFEQAVNPVSTVGSTRNQSMEHDLLNKLSIPFQQ